jgi:predicted phosphate transport protein (TIGR00153 family)
MHGPGIFRRHFCEAGVGLLSKLIPRDEQFFDLFDQLTTHLTQTARMLAELFDDPAHVTDHVRAIKDVEHKADVLTSTINQRIDKSFVTPIDREDIHMLASRLDDVIDLIDGTSRRFEMLHIDVVKEPARELARVLVDAAKHIQTGVASIRETKRVTEQATLIKRLEEEADAIYHSAVGDLFSGHPDPLEVLKWKEMYDTLERATDSCMGVAQVMQSISLKNA